MNFSNGELLRCGAPATRSPYKNMSSSSLSPRLEFHPFEKLMANRLTQKPCPKNNEMKINFRTGLQLTMNTSKARTPRCLCAYCIVT